MHARRLMNRADKKSPFDVALLPSADEVKQWDPTTGPCCTAERFRPDLTGSPGTPWNKSAVEVFVQDFVECDEYDWDDEAAIRKKFSSHLRYLADSYKLSLKDEETQLEVKKRANANGASVDIPSRIHGC